LAGLHRPDRTMKRVVTAVVLAMAAFAVPAASFTLSHMEEVGGVEATHGFRTLHSTPGPALP